MEFPLIQVTTVDYIITAATGNLINRKSKLFGIENVSVGGQVRFAALNIPRAGLRRLLVTELFAQCVIEEGATLHGDYADIELGLNCFVGKNVQLTPTAKQIRGHASPFDGSLLLSSFLIISDRPFTCRCILETTLFSKRAQSSVRYLSVLILSLARMQ